MSLLPLLGDVGTTLEESSGPLQYLLVFVFAAIPIVEILVVPGLAIASPVLTGVHIAAPVALLAGSRSRIVAGWMTAGILAWIIALVAASTDSVSLLGLA